MSAIIDRIDFTGIFNIRYKKIYYIIWIFGITYAVLSLLTNFYLTFLSLVGLVVFSAILIRPMFGFYLLIITLLEEMVRFFVMTQPYVTTKFYLHLIFLYPTFIGWCIAKSAGIVEKRPHNTLDPLVILVVIYQTVSILWAPSLEVSLLTLIILYSNFLLYYLPGALIRDQKTLKNCINAWIITGVIVGIGVLLTNNNFIHIGDTVLINKDMGFMYEFKEHHNRASGFAGSDHAGGFLILTSAFTIGYMIVAKGWKKILLFAVVIFLFYCNIVTVTRSTMFGNIALFFMFFFINPLYRKKLIKYSFITVILSFFVIIAAKPGMFDRTLIGLGIIDSPIFYEKEITSEETLENISGMGIRIIWWKDSLKVMLDDPSRLLLGLGLSGFVYHTTSPEVNGATWAFFYEMGIFGTILLIFILINLFTTFKPYFVNINFKEMGYPAIMLICAVLGYIGDTGIHGLIDYDLTGPGSRLVWFPLGFIMAILNIVKSRQLENETK